MKIPETHSYFVRRVTSANKTETEEVLVQASKDSLHDQSQNRKDERQNEDAVMFHSEEEDQPLQSKDDAEKEPSSREAEGLDLTA
jgi:hypothetical protein